MTNSNTQVVVGSNTMEIEIACGQSSKPSTSVVISSVTNGSSVAATAVRKTSKPIVRRLFSSKSNPAWVVPKNTPSLPINIIPAG